MKAYVIERTPASERSNPNRAPEMGGAATYLLDPTYEGHKYVWVSSVKVCRTWETCAFPMAIPTEPPSSWSELPMSRNGVSHPDDIIIEAGYTIIEDTESEYIWFDE